MGQVEGDLRLHLVDGNRRLQVREGALACCTASVESRRNLLEWLEDKLSVVT